jgi:hypothetical protein
VIALSRPQKLWGYGTFLRGGSRKSSAGIPETFVIREDNTAKLTLRVHDCEYLTVRAWILDAMRGNQFTFQFDALDPYSAFLCYLEAPTFEEGYEPKRDPTMPQIWNVDLTIRAVAAVPIYVSNTGLCGTTGTVPSAWILANFANGANFRLSVLPTPATFGSSLQLANLPNPVLDTDFHRSSAPEGTWDTLVLTKGIFVPDHVSMESQGPTGTATWARMGSNFTLKQMRGSTVIAQVTSPDYGSSSLVTGFVDYDVSSIGPLFVEAGDFIRLELNGYLQLKPDAPSGDDGFRNTYYYGAVFGPRTSPKLYGSSNVTE